jgi:hypothetical protein
MKHAAFLFALPLLLAAPALAAGDMALAPFSAIEAHAGAHVILKHGPQHVTLLKGDLKVSKIFVQNGTLMLEGCTGFWSCPRHYTLEVEVVSPLVERLNIHGGAELDARGDFPRQKKLAVEAHGGAEADLRAIPAGEAEADAHGGAEVHLGDVQALHVQAHGGAEVTYRGNPTPVRIETGGGAEVDKE